MPIIKMSKNVEKDKYKRIAFNSENYYCQIMLTSFQIQFYMYTQKDKYGKIENIFATYDFK